ncbi:MAG: hypothetical protein HC892_17315 [Saprospiraceae bacterium]|nr:hypothetical protein [Saprospiraceae bacterium]
MRKFYYCLPYVVFSGQFMRNLLMIIAKMLFHLGMSAISVPDQQNLPLKMLPYQATVLLLASPILEMTYGSLSLHWLQT